MLSEYGNWFLLYLCLDAVKKDIDAVTNTISDDAGISSYALLIFGYKCIL